MKEYEVKIEDNDGNEIGAIRYKEALNQVSLEIERFMFISYADPKIPTIQVKLILNVLT